MRANEECATGTLLITYCIITMKIQDDLTSNFLHVSMSGLILKNIENSLLDAKKGMFLLFWGH